MRLSKRILSALISLIILSTSLVPFSAQAATETSLRNAVMSVAEGEIGYKGTSTYSKYGEWYGYQGAWCTTFVLWCFNQAGSKAGVKMYGSIVPSGGNCNSMISWFTNKGRYYKRSSGYTPKYGDLIFFDWSGNGSSQHVGFVTGTSGSTVYTLEGNSSGMVRERQYTSSGSKPYNNISSIMGYASPDYSSVSGGSSNTTTKKAATTKKSTTKKSTTKKSTTKKSTTKSSTKKETTKKRETTTTTTTATTTTTTTTTAPTTQIIPLETLSINAPTYDLQIGDTVKLNYSVEPSDAPAVVGYFCDEEGIIEIGTDGDIKAIGSGTATVVVCANNELYKQCDFTVTEAVGEVTSLEVKDRNVVGTTKAQVVTTQRSVQSVLKDLGVNTDKLKQNKQLYVIPLAIISITFIISSFLAIVKKVKRR